MLPKKVYIFDCSRPNLLPRRGLGILRTKIGGAAERIHLVSDNGHFSLNVRGPRPGCSRFSKHAALVLEDAGRGLNPPAGVPPPSPRSVRAGAIGCKSGRECAASRVDVGGGGP